ncbi:uncharacterized protein LOC114277128 [Camellia sinensis]|uniref:uncharacterized protein LOC114277128 n=1 Tax=Camellia sinensis TaxID=4442 RepID=UPI001035CBE2|nr:uncharacterized protein LOC114277128 [Camellia sinensis]
MASESLTQLARRKNAMRMAACRRAEAERVQPPPPPPDAREETPPPAPVEQAETEVAEMEPVVDQLEGQVMEHKGEKHPAKYEADYSEEPIDKRPLMEESDLVVSFTIQPKIKNMSVAFDASIIRDPGVALSLASFISLPVDRVAFRAEADLLAIALATQSAILVRGEEAGRIAEIGRRQHDAIEQIDFLIAELENEKGKVAEASLRADFEAIKAVAERAGADFEADKAKTVDELRVATEGRANANEETLKLANETIAKLEADLEESKRAMANVESKISKSFLAGKDAALADYVE